MDRNGHLQQIKNSQRLLNGTCGRYDCSNAPSPGDLYTSYTLNYVKWFYKCGTGHDLTVVWDISVPYTHQEI
jgi:hypothetical protein